MKARESGMPEESTWATFFSPEETLRKLRLPSEGDVVDFGCGYGTFTIPAARITRGTVHALDIEVEMILAIEAKARAEGLQNVRTCLRDFMADGTDLPDESVDYVMLFNILHADCPEVLVHEAFRILRPGGKLGIVHWSYDPTTPRGPTMAIRPRPEQCQTWAEAVGFVLLPPGIIELPPYHYGMVLTRLAGP
jgi:ubiquinone/menaquinone biosynthesis C-methylase UbiE